MILRGLQVSASIRSSRTLMTSIKPHTLDLLVLPEMALTGYSFDAHSILPLTEDRHSGATSTLALALSARLHCTVIAGFPESTRYDQVSARGELGQYIAGQRTENQKERFWDGEVGGAVYEAMLRRGVGWNSAIAAREGRVVGVYRKRFLFETDKSWARAGALGGVDGGR